MTWYKYRVLGIIACDAPCNVTWSILPKVNLINVGCFSRWLNFDRLQSGIFILDFEFSPPVLLIAARVSRTNLNN